jgi:hypothetical protein
MSTVAFALFIVFMLAAAAWTGWEVANAPEMPPEMIAADDELYARGQ